MGGRTDNQVELDRHTGRQIADNQVGLDTHTDNQVGVDRHTDRQIDERADRQSGSIKQTHRLTNR